MLLPGKTNYKNVSDLYVQTDEYEILTASFEERDAGKRLDSALSGRLDDVSRNRIQNLIASGAVLINDNLVYDNNYTVKQGDVATVRLNVRKPLKIESEDIPIDIVYEDEDVIVVNKPKGMVVHPASGSETGTLVGALLYHMEKSGGSLPVINGEIRPGIVHRIDKNTSGLLVIAKNDRAHHALSEQLSAHSMTRVYIALVSGGFKEDSGVIDARIGRDPKDRKKQKVVQAPEGRNAVTHWSVIERHKNHTLLELKLETGRTHQIRVHLAHLNRPVVGDDLYGPIKAAKAAREAGGGQYLHARTLGFIHPGTGEYVEFEVPPPDEFTAMADKLSRQ
jgi:23S rRNA pseudouridine1911/1915/1917 synthase